MRGWNSGRLAALLLLGILLACGANPLEPLAPMVTGEVRSVDGLVRFINIEGGCWVIKAARAQYEPTNLPAELRVDSLPVHAVVRATGGASICMLGNIVTLDSIRIRR